MSWGGPHLWGGPCLPSPQGKQRKCRTKCFNTTLAATAVSPGVSGRAAPQGHAEPYLHLKAKDTRLNDTSGSKRMIHPPGSPGGPTVSLRAQQRRAPCLHPKMWPTLASSSRSAHSRNFARPRSQPAAVEKDTGTNAACCIQTFGFAVCCIPERSRPTWTSSSRSAHRRNFARPRSQPAAVKKIQAQTQPAAYPTSVFAVCCVPEQKALPNRFTWTMGSHRLGHE